METDLELPSSRNGRLNAELDKNNDDDGGNVVDDEILGGGDGVNLNVSTGNRSRVESYMPRQGMEFETKEAAYAFYRNYAWSVGFGITIKASRRSKKSGKFIDIKIACSRFGSRRQSCANISQKSCTKTDCKASMHIKKRLEGKWFIFNFVEGHNHELLPDDFCNTIRGRKNQDADAVCQKKGLQLVQDADAVCQKKGLQLVLDDKDVELLLDYFMHMQAEAPGFYYVIDFDGGAGMRNVFWVDSKGKHDYVAFSDVVFFDTHYIRNRYKIPFVPVVGVNSHFQFILLGCALIGDETKSTFTWLMRTWLRAVAGCSPKVVITDNSRLLIEATRDVFPNASHFFCPWHVFTEVGPNLIHKLNEFELFLMKLKKCAFRSWSSEEFDRRWQEMVKQFDLADDKWMQSLYEDRRRWIPTYMTEVFLGGFCTAERSQSVVSFFDKYLQKETTFNLFIDQYKLFLQNGREEELEAELETRSCGPVLTFHSPFEKQMSKLYTSAIFKKFQAEVLGLLSCTLEIKGDDGETIIYNVDDLERKQSFIVSWSNSKYEIYCLCRLFEYSGFLCRHALAVLQLSGIPTIPPKYVLKRWTQTAKTIDITDQASVKANFRVERLNDICKLAIKLGEEGSLSREAYKVAYHALEEAMEHCSRLNCSVKRNLETTKTAAYGLSEVGQNKDKSIGKISKLKVSKKRKVQAEPETLSIGIEESIQDVDQLNRRSNRLHDYYSSQHVLQGMESGRTPIISGYGGAEHGGQGLGHLTPPSSMQDCYYGDQPLMQGVPGYFSARSSHHAATQHNMNALLQGRFSFRPTSLEGFQPRDSLHNETSVNMMSKNLHN